MEQLVNHKEDTSGKLSRLRSNAIGLFEEISSVQLPYPINFRGDVNLSDEVKRFETYLIEYALERTAGNQVKAAEILGLNYSTLNAKIKRYGIDEKLKKSDPGPAAKISVRESLEAVEVGRDRRTIVDQLRKLKGVALRLVEEIEALRFAKTLHGYEDISLPDEMSRFEQHLIRQALDKTGGNQTRAAKILGIRVTTLNNKIKRNKIPLVPRFDPREDLRPLNSAN